MADCSKQATDLSTQCSSTEPCFFETHGPKWFAFDYYAAQGAKVTISTNIAADIYLGKSYNSNPDSFSNDIEFKGVT